MPLLIADDFYGEAQTALTLAGYVLTLVQRHEPTVVEGTTPGGASFRYSVSGAGWSLRYRTKTATGAALADWWVPSVVQTHLTSRVTAAGG